MYNQNPESNEVVELRICLKHIIHDLWFLKKNTEIVLIDNLIMFGNGNIYMAQTEQEELWIFMRNATYSKSLEITTNSKVNFSWLSLFSN